MLAFGFPSDAIAMCALCASLLLLLLPSRSWPKYSLFYLSACAGALSLGYFYFYLGGMPRIIDATTYLLEARSFADGSVGFQAPEPSASFRGRFLIHSAQDPSLLTGIFPPGYPALLSLGVALGRFEWVGPLIAVFVVVLTYHLALSLTHKRQIALLAACFSTICACLRYHHADTMSHGWAGLLSLSALLATSRTLELPHARIWPALVGFSLGLLLATRQLTGLVLLLTCTASLALLKDSKGGRLDKKSWFLCAAALLPGLTLLLSHHFAVTGSLFDSPQTRYYQFADGPLGCFGFGLGKGCHYEHAGVVAEQGGAGLTLTWALKNTLHRLHWHSLDIANFEPLVLVALYYAYKIRRDRSFWPLLSTLLLLPLIYSGFYFAGSYPGGGARFFSELLPLWHVLLAAGLYTLKASRLGVSAALFGFAVHASFSHQALASNRLGPVTATSASIAGLLEKELGVPATEWDRPPLVFSSSAHQFNLSWKSDPHFTIARRTRDDRERLLHSDLGRPSAWTLTTAHSVPMLERLHLEPVVPKPGLRLELESEFDYPPLDLADLWVHPEYLGLSCVSHGRALAIHPEGQEPMLSLETAGVPPASYDVWLNLVVSGSRCEARALGRLSLPSPVILETDELRGATHIDRLTLVLAHR